MIGKGFIVVGVNRSGTSAVAAALRALGVYFGRREDLPIAGADIDYDSSENRHIVEIGASILRSLEHDGLTARGMPDGWEEISDVTDRLPEVAKFIEVYFGDRPQWGWKDPRTSLLIPFFEHVFDRLGSKPSYLLPLRHPSEVAAGLEKRQGLSITAGIGYWIHYTLSALSTLEAERTVLFLYGDFVADPRNILAPVLAASGLERPSEADWQRVRDRVQPNLYRIQERDGEIPAFAVKVWELVRTLAAGADWQTGSTGREQIDELAAEWHQWSELTGLASVPIGEVRWVTGEQTGHMIFRGDREWHVCVLSFESGTQGWVNLWFLPRFRVVRLRGFEFGPAHLGVQPRAAVGESVFGEIAEGGDLRLYVFGPSPHLSIEVPRHRDIRELRFEFQVSAGKQAVTHVAERLASARASSVPTPVSGPGRR